jgi:hypothetical protein
MYQRFNTKPWLSLAVSLTTLFGAVTATAQFLPGKLRVEKYATDVDGNPLGGVSVESLTNNVKYPTSPDTIEFVTYAEYPQTGDINTLPAGNVENNYGIRVSGVVIPPTTGSYVFYLSADDGAGLWLSTDASPANARLIATEPVWNGIRNWLGVDRRPARENISAPQSLVAGQRYYFYSLMKEGGGGDNWAITWAPAGTEPAAGALPIDAPALGFDAPSSPTFTTPLANQTVEQNRTAALFAEATGPGENTTVPTYQWFRNGVAIDGAVHGKYTTPQLTLADSGAVYRLEADFGGTKIQTQGTITVTADTTPPTIVRAVGSESFRAATIIFDEEMDASVEVPANYSINNGLGVPTAVTRVNATTVRLTTASQQPGTNYVVTLSNVRDKAGNLLVANTVTFKSFIFRSTVVKYERYNTTATFEDFRDNIAGQVPPSFVSLLSAVEAPVNVASDYGGRVSGFLVPATTGDYVLFMSSDDRGALYLSTDDDPANLKQIAFEPTWNGNLQWVLLDRRNPDAPENRSDTFQDTQWPAGPGAPINLVAGRRYYFEGLWKEGGGGDNFAATWKLASEADPANGAATLLRGSLIGVAVDPSTLPPILLSASGSRAFKTGDTITLEASFDSETPMTYQWFKNNTPINGATNATYVITSANINTVGDYRCVATNPNGSGDSGVDDNMRLLMEGAFLIELEDYNHGGGLTEAVASTMPYLGNAYAAKDGLPGIDFHLQSQSTADAGANGNAYRNGYLLEGNPVDYPTAPEELGNVDVIGNDGNNNLFRGAINGTPWNVTVNYKIGWNTGEEWYNYTRTFPAGDYHALIAYSRDARGLNNVAGAIGTVTGEATQEQTVTEHGTFLAGGTGAWSSNDLVPFRDGQGNLATISLSGRQTIRITNTGAAGGGDYDIDWLMLYKVDTTPPPANLSITRSGANVQITYGGTLQSADAVTGPYADVAGASSPYSVTPAGTGRYYRSRN